MVIFELVPYVRILSKWIRHPVHGGLQPRPRRGRLSLATRLGDFLGRDPPNLGQGCSTKLGGKGLGAVQEANRGLDIGCHLPVACPRLYNLAQRRVKTFQAGTATKRSQQV